MAVLQSDAVRGHDCETASPEVKKLKGCDERLPEHLQWQFMGFKFDRCFNYYLRESSDFVQEAMDIFSWREKGFLPFQGTWLDQPNKVIEVLSFMEQLIHFKTTAEKKMADSLRGKK